MLEEVKQMLEGGSWVQKKDEDAVTRLTYGGMMGV